MRGVYVVTFDQQTLAAASGDYDIFEIVPATNKPIEIIGLDFAFKSEIAEAQEEQVALSFIRGYSTSSNGSAFTPLKTSPGDGAASFTAETIGATVASTGTPEVLYATNFNIRQGYSAPIPPEFRCVCTAAENRIVVRMGVALADDATASATLWVRELV